MTTPYPRQDAPPLGSYVSPIPARRAHLGDALASEWTKLRSVRSTLWTLGVMVVLLLGIGVIAALIVAASAPDHGTGSASGTRDMDGTPVLFLGFFGVLLGTICVITLGVLTIASEYSTGMIRSTLAACPSRARVLAAKSIVFFSLVFVTTTLSTAVVGLLQTSIVNAPSPSAAAWLHSTVGVGLYLATLGLLSLTIGCLIRHSTGAITVMLGVVLMPLVLAIFMYSQSLNAVRLWLLDYSVPAQLLAFYTTSGRPLVASGPSGWEPLWILLGVTAVTMVGAFFSLDRRDV